jgi:hypothetical protein
MSEEGLSALALSIRVAVLATGLDALVGFPRVLAGDAGRSAARRSSICW